MKSSALKLINNNKEKASRPMRTSTVYAVVTISLVLFSLPWIIDKFFIPEVSTVPGIGPNKCLYPYTNQIFIGVAMALSVVNIFVTVVLSLSTKSSSHWRVFIVFEAALLVGTAAAIVLNTAACNFDPTSYF